MKGMCRECGAPVPASKGKTPRMFCTTRCKNRAANRRYQQRRWDYVPDGDTEVNSPVDWSGLLNRVGSSNPTLAVLMLDALNAHRRVNGKTEVTL